MEAQVPPPSSSSRVLRSCTAPTQPTDSPLHRPALHGRDDARQCKAKTGPQTQESGHLSPSLQELRDYRCRGAPQPLPPGPCSATSPSGSGLQVQVHRRTNPQPQGEKGVISGSRGRISVLGGGEAQVPQVTREGAPRADLQRERVPHPDPAARISPGSDLLQVQATPQVHPLPLPQLEAPPPWRGHSGLLSGLNPSLTSSPPDLKIFIYESESRPSGYPFLYWLKRSLLCA